MPGHITNITDSDIVADPSRFNPRDETVWEWIWGDEAPDEDTFSHESGQSFLSGILHDHDLLFDALAYFVGFSEVNPDSYLTVKRHNPAVHPRWPMLRCAQVSIKGIKYDGTLTTLTNYSNGVRKLTLPLYAKYRFDITWSFPEFDFKEDGEVTSEWDRCIATDPLDEGEVISVDGGQYEYIAPTHATIDSKPPIINGPFLKVYAQRSGILVRAFGLPANYLLNEYGIPVHFVAAKGKVNSAATLGLPAGTLLLLDYKVPKKVQPVATRSIGALSFGITAEMHFGYTDPDRAEPSETRRGWQLVPAHYGTGTGWFGIRNKQNTAEDLYPYYDMLKLLQHYST